MMLYAPVPFIGVKGIHYLGKKIEAHEVQMAILAVRVKRTCRVSFQVLSFPCALASPSTHSFA
jgi:K+-transporting ATPase A subunit